LCPEFKHEMNSDSLCPEFKHEMNSDSLCPEFKHEMNSDSLCPEFKHEMNSDSSCAKLPVRMRLGLPAAGSPPDDRQMPRRRKRKVELKRNVMLGRRPDDKVKCSTHPLYPVPLNAARVHPLTSSVGATFYVPIHTSFYVDVISCYLLLNAVEYNFFPPKKVKLKLIQNTCLTILLHCITGIDCRRCIFCTQYAIFSYDS
jgi:hypothetical protein